MNCAVCNMELKTPARVNEILVCIHKKCLTKDLFEATKGLFRGYLYRKNGDTYKGYFHKQHEKL